MRTVSTDALLRWRSERRAALDSLEAVHALWSDIEYWYATKGPRWNAVVENLNDVHNAVAHSDETKLANVRTQQPLTLRTFRRWRSTLNGAATGFDTVVRSYLEDVTGKVTVGGGNHGAA